MPTNVGDIIRVSARQLVDGTDEVVNVFHFTVQAMTAPGDDQAILDGVGIHIGTAWLAIEAAITNNQAANIIDVYNVSDDYPVGFTPWLGGYVGGTAVSERTANQDALLVLWYTATKRVQGKTYLGIFGEGQMTNGLWSGTFIADVGDWVNAMQDETTGLSDIELRLGIWSRGAAEMHPIVTRRITNNPATQRRRRRGRGS